MNNRGYKTVLLSSWKFSARMAITLLLSSVLLTPVQAETAYVTDMLQLDLYASIDMSGRPKRKLRSGDRMEVLERDGRYARVKLGDGESGWVKSLYLTDKEPARTRVNSLEESNLGLEATLKQLRSELAAQKDQLAKYAAIQTDGDAIRDEVGGDIERLKQENSALMSTVKSFGTSVPASWLLVGVLLAFFAGAFGGWFWVDRQSRSRHGGYRVY